MAEINSANKADAQTPSKMLEQTDMRAQSPSEAKKREGDDSEPPHKANVMMLVIFTCIIGMGNIQAGFVISGNN